MRQAAAVMYDLYPIATFRLDLEYARRSDLARLNCLIHLFFFSARISGGKNESIYTVVEGCTVECRTPEVCQVHTNWTVTHEYVGRFDVSMHDTSIIYI